MIDQLHESSRTWLLLVHHVPPKPAYFRAKVLRRLAQLGAIPIKKSAYLLPDTDTALEDFQWLRKEIDEQGGKSWVVRGSFVGGLDDEEAREAFRAARAADYDGLIQSLRDLLERARAPEAGVDALAAEWRRVERRRTSLRNIDFFDAPGRQEVDGLMDAVGGIVNPPAAGSSPKPRDLLKGRTWMTRPGVKIDRIASAWLIRRFIDPAATFVFGGEGGSPAGVLRFDTFEGEFTHDGDLCTFEVLLRASEHGADAALVTIAQIVHDLDLKDNRFERPETAGVAAMVAGVIARTGDDRQRLAEGASLFEALYASLTSGAQL